MCVIVGHLSCGVGGEMEEAVMFCKRCLIASLIACTDALTHNKFPRTNKDFSALK